jgi:flagellar hook protein FlgE
VVVGMIGMSRFSNASGLEQTGNNRWQESLNSGVPVDDVSQANGMGQLSVGYLEMSNVDLATEFTEMIKAQRGFQANSRVITTSDEILQELVNLKR